MRKGYKIAFQFHIGAIISRVGCQIKPTLVKFQFHIGAIISPEKEDIAFNLKLVSIPHWCNYKRIVKAGDRALVMAFQFHIGAIISP